MSQSVLSGEGAGAPPRRARQVPPQPPSLLPADEALGELVALATRLLGASAGVLLLAEPRGDWLAASYGLAPAAPKLLPQARLAERTAASTRVLRLESPRELVLASHPLVSFAPHLRTYLGAPVRSSDGAWTGALAVLDAGALTPAPELMDAFAALGRQAAARLQLLRQLRGLEDAERALRESEERFRLFANNAPDVLYRVFLEPELRLDFVSASVTELLGYLPEELYAEPDLALRLVHPEDRARLLGRARAGEPVDVRPVTLRWIRADGTVVHTEHRERALTDESGRVVAVEGVARDITDRRRAEEQHWRAHAMLQAVVEGSGDAIFVKDVDGRYVLINPMGACLLGREVHEVLGKYDGDLFEPASARDIVQRDRELLAQGQPRTYEVESTVAGVTRTWLSTKMPLIGRDGKVSGLVGVSRDITLHKQRELAREHRVEELERLLRLRDEQHDSARERLGAVTRMVESSLGSAPQELGDVVRALRRVADELSRELQPVRLGEELCLPRGGGQDARDPRSL